MENTTLNNSLDSLIKRVEALENNKKIDSLANNFFTNKAEVKSKLSILENMLNEATKIIKLLQDKSTSIDNNILADIKALDNKISNFSLRRIDLLKSLSTDGSIDLKYDLIIVPRVLPKKAKDGTLIIDIKDNKLKYYYNKEWRIVNG